jgi:hypothetical protein
LSHIFSSFFSGYLGDGVSRAVCPGWPWTLIFPISSSQIARIIGESHLCLTALGLLRQGLSM